MTEKNYRGNISTIATWISILLYPIIVKYGIEIDQEILTTFIYTLIVIAIAVFSSYNPNSFDWLGNGNLVDMGTILGYPSQEVVLNEEYETEVEGDQEDGC